MTTVKDCPECGADLFPHCDDSTACDLVRCRRCGATGSLDGRYWTRRDEGGTRENH